LTSADNALFGLRVYGQDQAGDRTPVVDETVFARVGEQPLAVAKIDYVFRQRQASQGSLDRQEPSPELRRAIAGALVRQELAHQMLEADGGDALRQLSDRAIDRFAALEASRGSSLIKAAAQLGLTPNMFRREIAWQMGWREYLRRYQTNEYQRKWFDRAKWRYDGSEAEIEQFLWPMPENASGEAIQRLKEQATRWAEDLEAGSRPWSAAAADEPDAPRWVPATWVQAIGSVPPPVARAAFEGEMQRTLGPVRSPVGLHVLRVLQRKSGHGDFTMVDQPDRLKRDLADFLLEQLVRRRLADVSVQWLDDSLAPPVGHLLRRVTDDQDYLDDDPSLDAE
jgi:hypothetical protein